MYPRRAASERQSDMSAKKTLIKLGSVSFLNAKPITHAIENSIVEHDFSIVQTPPSELSGILSRKEIDLGLIPVAEFLKRGTYSAVPGISISSYGKVDSVVLLTKEKLKNARTVAVDLRSQSSTALLRVILEVFHGLKPSYTPRDATKGGFLEGVDAGMIIGDLGLEMMYAPPAGYNVYDLGEIWTAETGLPFVFAVFAVGRGISLGRNVAALAESMAYGREHAAEIARIEAAKLGMDEAMCVTYLTERIQYDLGPREQEGIVKYSELLSELGISKKISGVDIYAEEKN